MITRSDYDEYIRRFNARDYDGVFDFFAPAPRIAFFGIEIRSREELRNFYGFLHQYVRETIQVRAFVASEDLVAVEALVKIEGIRDLGRDTLVAAGYGGLHPIKAGECQEMLQYIHYRVEAGRFVSVGCAIPLS